MLVQSFRTYLSLALFLFGMISCAQHQMSHGQEQIRAMLRDRPAMRTYTNKAGETKKLTPQDEIWIWAERRFNQPVNGNVIKWDHNPPNKPANYPADHVIPTETEEGLIRIRSRLLIPYLGFEMMSFERLWQSCIFELINIQKAQDFLAVNARALEGCLDQETFVKESAKIEYQSNIELQAFFEQVWQPWAKKNQVSSYLPWGVATQTYEQWLDSWRQAENQNIYWEDYYISSVVPYLAAADKSKLKCAK